MKYLYCPYCNNNSRLEKGAINYKCDNHKDILIYFSFNTDYTLRAIRFYYKNSVIEQFYNQYDLTRIGNCYFTLRNSKFIQFPNWWATDKNINEIINKIKTLTLLI